MQCNGDLMHVRTYLSHCRCGEKRADFGSQHIDQRTEVISTAQYGTAESTVDVTVRVAIECGASNLLAVGIVLILYEN